VGYVDESDERVHAVEEFWDGPRSGVADVGGEPHAFDSVFDEALDDWSDEFFLRPIDAPTLTRVVEAWRAVAEFEAMNLKRTPEGAWRPLASDAAKRYQEVLKEREELWQSIRPDGLSAFRMRGSFRGPRPYGPFIARWSSARHAALQDN
jgi:hypothetical protein